MKKTMACLFCLCLTYSCSSRDVKSSQGDFAVTQLESLPRIYSLARTGGNYMHNYYLPPAGTGSPWWPSWSPDGKYLLFSMQGSIWKIAPDDTAAEEIAYSGEYLSSPEWSPDGRYIVFTSDKNGQSINLKLLDPAADTVTDLTTGDHLNLDPVWAPDGKRLAYVSTQPNGYFNIFVMELDGNQPGQIIQLTQDSTYSHSRLYFGTYDLHIQPSWTPDGEHILFVSNRGIPLGSGAVWKMPVRKNGIEQAVMIHHEETLYRTRPHISLDGKRFIYSSHLGGQFNNLFILPTQGGEPYKMTFGEWDHFHPRWSPDGMRIAYISNRKGMPSLHVIETYGGADEEIEIKTLTWKRPMGKLRFQVKDAASGEQLAARIYNTAADGKTYVPWNSYHRVGSLKEHFFHTPGEFTLEVPEGNLRIEAMHGFEFYPLMKKIDVKAGEILPLEINLVRMSNLPKEGWYGIDSHMHMNYAGNLHNTPENMLMMAKAEDIHISNILAANKDNRILDNQYFTGSPHPLSNRNHILFFNQEYRPPFYGHISLINLEDHLISPYTTGYENTAIESLYPSNTDIFKIARRQGALGGYVHPFSGDSDPLEGTLGGAKSFPVDLALGMVDYHEMVSWASRAAYDVWHHALNNGFRIIAVAGEDAISNLHDNRIVGQARAYAHMPDGLSWEGWTEAIRSGKMFVTNGPLLRFSVQGSDPGGKVTLPRQGGIVKALGSVSSIVPLDRAELVINGTRHDLGDLSLHSDPEGPGTLFTFEKNIEIHQSSWITLQTSADKPVHPIDDGFPHATTNPIWISVGDRPVRSEVSAEYFIRWIEKLSGMAEAHPGWRSDWEKEHVLGQFREALAVYKQRLGEAREYNKENSR